MEKIGYKTEDGYKLTDGDPVNLISDSTRTDF